MLEYAVRPYQTPNSQGKIIIPSTPGSSTARATITWSAKNSMNLPSASGVNVTCCGENLTETTREGDILQIPITKPDGSTGGYVEVFRSSTLKLNNNKEQHCDTPMDQYLASAFGLDLGIDELIPTTSDANCQTEWHLNNNTAAA